MILVRAMKEEIINGLVDLLNEEKYENITVKSLCKKCYISRTTFYNYYKSINEVLTDLENKVMDDMDSIYREYNYQSILDININDPAPNFYEMYKYIYNHKNIFKYIYGDNCPKSYYKKTSNSIHAKLNLLFSKYMEPNQAKEAANIVTGFVLSSGNALVEETTTLTPKQMSIMLKNTIADIIRNKDIYFNK
jgi:AcrR family transcriptional regulator